MDKDSKDKVLDQFDLILRHIENVRNNCEILARKCIEKGDTNFGLQLMQRGLRHDLSKLNPIEFELLNSKKVDLLKLGISQHQQINDHHMQFWGDYREMPRIAIYEMVCDLKARSNEFGTDLREYIDKTLIKKCGFSKQCRTYQWAKEALDLLLDKPFEEIVTV